MPKVSLNIIRNWFKTGLKPTQAQFWDTWDSFWHKDEPIAFQNVEGLSELVNNKVDVEAFENHLNDADAHGVDQIISDLTDLKQLVQQLEAQINTPSTIVSITTYGSDVDESGDLNLSAFLTEEVRKSPSVFVDGVSGNYLVQFNKQTKVLTGLYGINPEATIEIFF